MTTTPLVHHRTSFSSNVISIAAATVGAVLLWWVETRLLDIDLVVDVGGTAQRVTATTVSATALVAGLAGAATAWVLTRLAPHSSRTAWTALSGAVLLLSLLGPLGGVSAAVVFSLVALHLFVGLTLVIGLRPAARPVGGYGE